jgi:pimeloyl-ACP methyl ester carboxylesterase
LSRLVHNRAGAGPPVVLLHGWPGDRTDWRAVRPRLDGVEAIVPDLLGFGETGTAEDCSAPAQAAAVLELIDGLEPVVIGGYDVGSRVAQAIAREAPERVHALVLAPPLPGARERVLTPDAQREFWYQAFHRLPLAERLIDGDRDAVRAYLTHFWEHWSGPGFALEESALDHLLDVYSRPGAFTASIEWYRVGSGTVAMALAETPFTIETPTTVLWPEHDPLFPPAWSDRVGGFFPHATVEQLPGIGHFTPLEAPDAFAAALMHVRTPTTR